MQISRRNCHARDSIGRDVPGLRKVRRRLSLAKTRKSLRESSEVGLCGSPTDRGFLCLRRSLFPSQLLAVFASRNYRQSFWNRRHSPSPPLAPFFLGNSAAPLLVLGVCLKVLFRIVDRGIEILVFDLSKRYQLYLSRLLASGYSPDLPLNFLSLSLFLSL